MKLAIHSLSILFYSQKVNKKIGISPGTYTRRLAVLKDRINRRKKSHIYFQRSKKVKTAPYSREV